MSSEPLDDEQRPTADLAWERRWGRVTGGLACVSVVATIAAVPVAATDVAQKVGKNTDLTLLTSIGQSGSGQLAAMILRVVSIAALIPFALFLYRAVAARGRQSHSHYVPVVGVVAFVIVGVATVVGFFEVRDVAREFVASGPQTLERAKTMLSDARGGGRLQAANIAQMVGGVLFGIWISLTSMEASRVGLLTRFLGIFGLGAGVATAIGIPVSSALFLAWLGSLGLLAFGYWPGGRPLAWETGRAESPLETERPGRVGRQGSEPV